MTERAVTVSAGLLGTVMAAKPPGPRPVVVMLHGFGGHRDETGDLFAKLAKSLAKEGLSSLRIDFPGCGKSEGEFGDATVPLYRRAAIASIRFARSAPGMDAERVGLLGFSFGGAIATACLAGDAPKTKALALWGAVGDPAVDMVESLGAERAAEAERAGAVTVPWGKGEIKLKRAFFKSLGDVKPLEAIKSYKGSVLVMAGGNDKLAKYVGPLHDAAANAARREQKVIEGADHFFGANERRSPHVETLMTATTEFFAAALKK